MSEFYNRICLLLHRLYDAAGYEDYIYAGNPQPLLEAEEAAWAAELMPRAKR